MNKFRFVLTGGATVLILAMTYMLIDCTISLDHSRMHNSRLGARCELLGRLADEGLRGRPIVEIIQIAGINVLVKDEGATISFDDVVLRVQNGQVLKVEVEETCR